MQLTCPGENGAPTPKLVIVIDELDRCRPDYALSLLETIKHFFAVDGVHFVLGVNLKELQNSVRARYGVGANAETYLQKFVNLHYTLPSSTRNEEWSRVWQHYFRSQSKTMGLSIARETLVTQVILMLETLRMDRDVSLRDVDRVLSVIALTPESVVQLHIGKSLVASGLTILKAIRPEKYVAWRDQPPTRKNFDDVFDLSRLGDKETRKFFNELWGYLWGNGTTRTEAGQLDRAFGNFPLKSEQRLALFRTLPEEYLETFEFLDS